MDRQEKIFSHIPKCNKFADVGCDHGVLSLLMLKNGLCKELVYSDISKPSLAKAQRLLSGYSDLAKGVCCDGLSGVDADCDCVCIAGMGGQNIISIIENSPFLPKHFVLQPMRNVPEVREYIVSKGYKINKDLMFSDRGKFYDLIVAKKGKDNLTEQEIRYGRTNLINPSEDFLRYLNVQADKLSDILDKLPKEQTTEKSDELMRIKELYERLRTKKRT